MPRGSKSKYTSKQKRKAEHIEEGYENAARRKKKRSAALGRLWTNPIRAARKAEAVAVKNQAKRALAKGGRKKKR